MHKQYTLTYTTPGQPASKVIDVYADNIEEAFDTVSAKYKHIKETAESISKTKDKHVFKAEANDMEFPDKTYKYRYTLKKTPVSSLTT